MGSSEGAALSVFEITKVGKPEFEAAAELERARGAKGGDVAEGAAADGWVRVGENGVIEHVERLEANLERGLAVDVEPAEDAGVDVGPPGPRNSLRCVLLKIGATIVGRRLAVVV